MRSRLSLTRRLARVSPARRSLSTSVSVFGSLACVIPLFLHDLPAFDSRGQPPMDMRSRRDSSPREEGQAGESE